MIIQLANASPDVAVSQDYQYAEFFAGAGNIHKAMQHAGYKSARFEIGDSSVRPGRKSNHGSVQ